MTQPDVHSALFRWHSRVRAGAFELDPIEAKSIDASYATIVMKVRSVSGISLFVETPEYLTDRAWTMYIGLAIGPSWQTFNRVMSNSERAEFIDSHGTLTYWTVRLSRLGPFYCNFWNDFISDGHEVRPQIGAFPGTYEWTQVLNEVRTCFQVSRLRELSQSELDEHVASPELLVGGENTERASQTTAPTVLEELFLD